MYAVVKISGHQYKVSPGQSLTVDHLQAKQGEIIEFPALLVVDDKKQVTVGKEAGSTLVALKIVGDTQGEKIHIRRFRAKSRHRRHIGFRADLTSLTVESIGQTKKEISPKAHKKIE